MSIMMAQLRYQQIVIDNFIDDAVFPVYAPGPVAGESELERFGLART